MKQIESQLIMSIIKAFGLGQKRGAKADDGTSAFAADIGQHKIAAQ